MMTTLSIQKTNMHFDLLTTVQASSTALLSTGTCWLGWRTYKLRGKIDTRSGDQKDIERLTGRVSTLEDRMDDALQKIETLRDEKMQLQAEIASLRQQIGILEIKKTSLETRETMFTAQIADLQERLTVKTEQLRCAEEKLESIEQKEVAKEKL